MIIKIFEDYNADVNKLIGIDYSKSTSTKYDRTKRFAKEFILWKYKLDDIHIRQLNFDFVNQFELWLKTIRKWCHTIKEALVGFVHEDEASGLLFIKIKTEEVSFTDEEVQGFERLDKYPLQYTFNFAVAEVERQTVDAGSVNQLIGKTIVFGSNGDTILYIRTHLEINQNKILIEQNSEGFILTWSGVTDDINYYDHRAKPNPIYIRTPVALKQYESVDQCYELEYRSKIQE